VVDATYEPPSERHPRRSDLRPAVGRGCGEAKFEGRDGNSAHRPQRSSDARSGADSHALDRLACESHPARYQRGLARRDRLLRRCCDNEHIDRCNIGQVVAQKATPSRGGDLGPPRQVSSDRGLADLNAESEQFAMDAGGCLCSKVYLAWELGADDRG
jgi:hypothetical protein